jgi:hypothetical protein
MSYASIQDRTGQDKIGIVAMGRSGCHQDLKHRAGASASRYDMYTYSATFGSMQYTIWVMRLGSIMLDESIV